jgi:thiamine-phosphate pyrophosphorylase
MAENFMLIVITAEEAMENETALINALFETGLPVLHLRKPSYPSRELAALIHSIPEKFHQKIVIHNNYELLSDFNLMGAHLPEKIRKEGRLRGIKNIVSTSFHSLEDLRNEKLSFKYAFLSPVFQSVSKQGYLPSIKPKAIKDLFHSYKVLIRFPVIALGGITDKTILEARDMGFHGAASVGYIWESLNPAEQFKKLQNILHH